MQRIWQGFSFCKIRCFADNTNFYNKKINDTCRKLKALQFCSLLYYQDTIFEKRVLCSPPLSPPNRTFEKKKRHLNSRVRVEHFAPKKLNGCELNMQNGLKNSGGKAPQEISSLGKDGIKKLLDSTDTFIFDCDGVIWHSDKMLPASPKFIAFLRKLGKKVFFITNNSLFTQDEILNKFKRGGIDVPKDDLMFPAILLSHHLTKINFKGKIEILGEPALKNEIQARGFEVNKTKWDSNFVKGESEFRSAVVVTEPISAVVLDIDLNANFVKLTRILDILLKNKDCLYFSGASDKKIPLTSTLVTAGPRYVLDIIKDLTGRTPQVLGKPSTGMFEVLKEKHNLDPERILFIGDSLESDILMAAACGIRSILVLTGTTRRENIPTNDPQKRPNYVSESIAELLSYMEEVVL